MWLEADEYANFKHYKTRDFIKIVGNGGYAVASLPPAGELGSETVLLYQIDRDDFILLEELSFREMLYNEEHMRYYKDKLYIFDSTISMIYEFTLDGVNTRRKDLIFDMSDIFKAEVIMYDLYSIEKIESNYIYFRGSVRGYNDKGNKPAGHTDVINMKCSLIDYKCSEIKGEKYEEIDEK